MTVDLEGFEASLYTTSYSQNTIRIYVRRMAHYVSSGEPTFSAWVSNAHRAGAKAQVVSSMLAAAKAYCNYACLDDQRRELNKYKAPKPAPPSPHPLPNGIDDLYKMLEASSGFVRLAVGLGGFAGTRVSETRSLDEHSIDNNYLIIRGKGDKTRRVPINEPLANLIEEEYEGIGPMVPYGDSWLRKRISQSAIDAGVLHRDGSVPSSHDLRATFATGVFNRTKDIWLVSQLLGHGDVKQTQTYLGIDSAALELAVAV